MRALQLVHVGVRDLLAREAARRRPSSRRATARAANAARRGRRRATEPVGRGRRCASATTTLRNRPRRAAIASAITCCILTDLVVGRGAFVARFAHDEDAHRGVPDVAREVDQRAPRLDRVEVLREGLELVPRHAREQRVGRHVLDVLQRAHEQLAVLGPHGRDREAAVAGDDRRDAVPTARRQRRVPEDLRVVVGVDVDEARRDDLPRGVELPAPRESGADLGDDPVGDGDVGDPPGRARPVDDRSAPDHNVCGHGSPRG